VYVPGKVIVDRNAAAENIRQSEGLVRIGLASELVHQIICVLGCARRTP
jgi:hypothetical protein